MMKTVASVNASSYLCSTQTPKRVVNNSINIKLYTYEEVFRNTGNVNGDILDRLISQQLADVKFRQIP